MYCCVSLFKLLFSFIFFFQAEDGIRDGHVTGVQTCALPILFTIGSSCRLKEVLMSERPPVVLYQAFRSAYIFGLYCSLMIWGRAVPSICTVAGQFSAISSVQL